MATTLLEEDGADRAPKATTVMGAPGSRGTIVLQPEGATSSDTIEPVVAWLVIVAGPGRGKSMEISYGMTTVGRSETNRLRVDFGDNAISSQDSLRVAYDGENREFHLIPGGGPNLVYMGNKPVLTPEKLSNGAEFRMGATTFRFVPLCSTTWDWSLIEPKV